MLLLNNHTTGDGITTVDMIILANKPNYVSTITCANKHHYVSTITTINSSIALICLMVQYHTYPEI